VYSVPRFYACFYLYENRETAQMQALQEVPYGYHAMLNMERACWYG
jgi:hypothetical protein